MAKKDHINYKEMAIWVGLIFVAGIAANLTSEYMWHKYLKVQNRKVIEGDPKGTYLGEVKVL